MLDIQRVRIPLCQKGQVTHGVPESLGSGHILIHLVRSHSYLISPRIACITLRAMRIHNSVYVEDGVIRYAL